MVVYVIMCYRYFGFPDFHPPSASRSAERERVFSLIRADRKIKIITSRLNREPLPSKCKQHRAQSPPPPKKNEEEKTSLLTSQIWRNWQSPMTISMSSVMRSEFVYRMHLVFPMQNTKYYELKSITEFKFRKLLEQFHFRQYSHQTFLLPKKVKINYISILKNYSW